MRFFVFFLLVFQMSCARKDEKSQKTNQYLKLNTKREEFLKTVFFGFQRDVEQAQFYLNQYESLKLGAMNLNGREILPLSELDKNFKLEYGQNLVEIQNLLKSYEVESEKWQLILKTLKNDLDILSNQHQSNLSFFKICKEEAKTQKANIEKKRDEAADSVNPMKIEFDSFVSSAKSHRDSAAKWKKKVAHSNWPPDKKRYAEKARGHAEKAKRFAQKANSTYDSISNYLKKIEQELSVSVEKFNQKFSQCKMMNSKVLREGKDLEVLANEYRDAGDHLISVHNKMKQLYSDQEEFFRNFDQYKLKRDAMVGSLKELIVKRKERFEKAHQDNVINYGVDYLNLYKKIADWLAKTYVDGNETANLLKYLTQFDTIQVKVIYQHIFDILESASDKKISQISNDIDRNIASLIFIEIGDIKIPSLPSIKIELPRLPEIKIELPDLPEIKIDLPSLRLGLPEIRLDLPQINLNLPQITLTNTLPDIKFELPEFMYFKLDKISLKVDIPELEIAKISWDISGDIGHLFEQIKSIRINLPSIELVRIEADLWGDIQKPEKIFQNAGRESTKTAKNVYREIGNGVKEMRNIYLQSKGVNFDKLMTQLRKGISVCRNQKSLVKTQVEEIKTVVDLLEAKRLGSISDDEFSKRYEKMLKETQILQGYGLTVAGVGSLASSAYLSHLLFSMGATTISSSTMLVGQIGLVGIGVAATLNYMAASAQRELEIEHDKIKDCSNDLKKLLDELNHIQNSLILDELEGRSLLARVNKSIEDHQKELFEIDFSSETYLEMLDALDQKVYKEMLEFKQSAILLGDKQTLKLITDFISALGLEL